MPLRIVRYRGRESLPTRRLNSVAHFTDPILLLENVGDGNPLALGEVVVGAVVAIDRFEHLDEGCLVENVRQRENLRRCLRSHYL